jgi:cysteine desulfurase
VNVRTFIPPYILGGGQEKGKRSGTSNVPGVVGMAEALKEAVSHMDENVEYLAGLRVKLIQKLTALPNVELTGHPTNRLPGLASFLVRGVEGEPLVKALNEAGICLSSGSACSAGSGEPSRVLKAMGFNGLDKAAPIRISLCEKNTDDEIDYIISKFPPAVAAAKATPTIPQNINLDDY